MSYPEMKLKVQWLKDRVGFAVFMIVYGVLIGVMAVMVVGVLTSSDYPDDKLTVHTRGVGIQTEMISEIMEVVEKYGGTVDEVLWESVGSDDIRIRFANWKKETEE